MLTTSLAALSLLLAPAARAAGIDVELSRQMTVEASSFLEAMLGPGRARVTVQITGEKTAVSSSKELETPVEEAVPGSELPLPGYAEGQVRRKISYIVKSQDRTARDSAFEIRKISVALVLDGSVAAEREDAVRRALSLLLHLDDARGDEINLERAAMQPIWRRVLAGPEGQRAAMLLGAAGVLLLILTALGYAAGRGLVAAFVRELAAFRPAPAALPAEARPSPLPAEPLFAGGLPSLTADFESGEPGPRAALGRRFDFLAERRAEELSGLLESETPEDLALLFAYLSETNPELSALLFSALPYAKQSGVSQALAGLTMADPEKLAMLENRLRTTVEYGLRGSERLGRILSRIPAEQREGILGDLGSAAAEVERAVFPFEALAGLKAADLRRLILAVTREDWGAALKGAPGPLAAMVLDQFVAEPRELLRQQIEAPMPQQRVLEARSKILSQARALADSGQIELTGAAA